MIDLVAYRISIGTFSNSHVGKEARLAEMFPGVKRKIVSILPIILLSISALHIRDDAGVESNPGPTTFDCSECGRTKSKETQTRYTRGTKTFIFMFFL